MHGQMKHADNSSDNLNSKECSEDLGIDGKITLKQLLQKDLVCGLSLIGARQNVRYDFF
jgi:hypothetical protein